LLLEVPAFLCVVSEVRFPLNRLHVHLGVVEHVSQLVHVLLFEFVEELWLLHRSQHPPLWVFNLRINLPERINGRLRREWFVGPVVPVDISCVLVLPESRLEFNLLLRDPLPALQ